MRKIGSGATSPVKAFVTSRNADLPKLKPVKKSGKPVLIDAPTIEVQPIVEMEIFDDSEAKRKETDDFSIGLTIPKKDLLIPESPRRSINIMRKRRGSFDSKMSSPEQKKMTRIGSSLSVGSHKSKGSKGSKS